MKLRLVILFTLAGLVGMLIWQLRLETRLSVFFLGRSDTGSQLVERFQRSVFARRYLLAIEGRAEKRGGLGEVSRRFVTALNALPGVSSAWPAFRPPFSVPDLIAGYAPYGPLIYSLDPAREAADIFAVEFLSARAGRLKKVLLSPFGDLVQKIASQDPLLLTLRAFSDWRDRYGEDPRQTDDFYPIILESRYEPFDISRQRQLQWRIEQEFSRLARDHESELRLRITGVPVFAVSAQQRVKRDVSRVTLASSIGVLGVLWWLFRSWKMLPAITLVLGFACTVGALATQWFFGNVHALTLALGATLIGVCVDYPIHLLAHCREGIPPGRVARRLWPTLTLGAATTVIGYLALAATGYPGFQQTAVFAMAGIVTALLATLFMVPPWVQGMPFHASPSLGMFTALQEGLVGYRRLLLTVLGVGLAAALLLLLRLEWLDDLERLAGFDARLRQQDTALRKRLGGIEPGRAILVNATDLETALQRGETATGVLRRLREQGALSTFHAIYPWLVSQRLQEANWRHYTLHVTSGFVRAWRTALVQSGLSADALALQVPGPSPDRWLEAERMLDSEVSELLPGQVDVGPERVHLALWLGPHDPQAVAAAFSALPGIRYYSQREQINALAIHYRQRATLALEAGVGVILLLLTLRYRSPIRAFRVLLPGMAGLVFIFACFALLGQPVSFFHLIAAMLAVAICVDYGIFYFERRAGDAGDTYRAMGASMLTTVVAFAALGLADNPALKALSVAVAGGVSTGFLLCPVVLPGGWDE